MDHVAERLERQIRIDHAGAVAEQQRAVVHFARIARLDDQRAAGAAAFADEMMVHAGGGQQARNRRQVAIGAAVRQDQDVVARLDRLAGASFSRSIARARPEPSPLGSNTICSVVERKPG